MNADDDGGEEGSGGLASTITQQKVAAAKSYIEQHYKMQMKSLQERRERCTILCSQYFLLFNYRATVFKQRGS